MSKQKYLFIVYALGVVWVSWFCAADETAALIPEIAASPALPAAMSAPPDWNIVQLELTLYQIHGNVSGKTSLTDIISMDGDGNPKSKSDQAGTFAAFGRADLTVGSGQLKAQADRWNWESPDSLPKEVRIMASPKLLVRQGESFSIEIGTQIPNEYFVKRDDGLFEHKTTQEKIGLAITGKVLSQSGGQSILVKLAFNFRAAEKREPIEGVGLEVGKIQINEKNYDAFLRLEKKMNCGILIDPVDDMITVDDMIIFRNEILTKNEREDTIIVRIRADDQIPESALQKK